MNGRRVRMPDERMAEENVYEGIRKVDEVRMRWMTEVRK